MTPREHFAAAALQSLLARLSLLDYLPAAEVPQEAKQANPILQQPISTLGLPSRAQNALANARITTIGELVLLSSKQVCCFRSVGSGTVSSIKQRLKHHGLELNDNRRDEDRQRLHRIAGAAWLIADAMVEAAEPTA